MFVLNNIFYIITSFLGVHPWTLNERFNADMVMLSGIIFSVSLGLFLKTKFNLDYNWTYKFAVFFFLMLPFVNVLNIYHHSNHNDVFGEIKKLSFTTERIFISRSMWAMIKYLYEYGALRGENYYPNKFIQVYSLKEKFEISPQKKYALIRHGTEELKFEEIFKGQYGVEEVPLILRATKVYLLTGKASISNSIL